MINSFLFRKSYHRWDKVKVRCKAGQATDENVVHEHCMLDYKGYKHTLSTCINLLLPNDHYSGRTAPLNSKRCILYIYSTNTEYFKHGIYSLFSSLFSKCSLFHNYNVLGSCIIHVLYTGCAKIKKKIIPAPNG